MCDSLCALGASTVAGTTLFAKNSDRPPTEAQDLEWHPPRRDAGPLAATYIDVAPHDGDTLGVLGSRPRWMWGMEHGVNEVGLAVGNEAVWTTLDPRSAPAALVGMDLVRLALERATDAATGVETIVSLVERYGQGGAGHEGGRRPYWSSFLLADPHRAFVVETSGPDVAVEEISDRRAISNRLTIPDFAAAHGLDVEPIQRRVDPRLAASERCLGAGPVSVDALRSHLRAHAGGEDGWTICMHADGEATTAGMVAELPGDRPPIVHVVAGQPCRSIFVPLVVGQPIEGWPDWERFAALADEDELQDELRTLEAELVAGVTADAGWNEHAIGRVAAALARA